MALFFSTRAETEAAKWNSVIVNFTYLNLAFRETTDWYKFHLLPLQHPQKHYKHDKDSESTFADGTLDWSPQRPDLNITEAV